MGLEPIQVLSDSCFRKNPEQLTPNVQIWQSERHRLGIAGKISEHNYDPTSFPVWHESNCIVQSECHPIRNSVFALKLNQFKGFLTI